MKKTWFLPALLPAVLVACSDDDPEQIASVSNSDFTKYTQAKLWVDGSAVGKPVKWEIVSSTGETFDHNPWTGGIWSLDGFSFDGQSFTGYCLNSGSNPPYFSRTVSYSYDQSTGFCSTGMDFCSWGINDNSLYIESINNEQIEIRYNYGILPKGYKENESVTDPTPDPGSYVRQTFYAMPSNQVEKWTSRYSPKE